MLLSLLYADAPKEQREIWKEFQNHRKKHSNMGIDIASNAVVEGIIVPEAAAVALKAKEGPDPDTLEELKQALIYCDCITDAQGLPQVSCPVDISEHAEADAKRLLESAREAAAHLYPFSEETHGSCALQSPERTTGANEEMRSRVATAWIASTEATAKALTQPTLCGPQIKWRSVGACDTCKVRQKDGERRAVLTIS